MKEYKKLFYSLLGIFSALEPAQTSIQELEGLPTNHLSAAIRVRLNPEANQYSIMCDCFDSNNSVHTIMMSWKKTDIANRWMVAFSGSEPGTRIRYGKNIATLVSKDALLVKFDENGVMMHTHEPFNPLVEFTWHQSQSKTVIEFEFINPKKPNDACKIIQGEPSYKPIHFIQNVNSDLDKIN